MLVIFIKPGKIYFDILKMKNAKPKNIKFNIILIDARIISVNDLIINTKKVVGRNN